MVLFHKINRVVYFSVYFLSIHLYLMDANTRFNIDNESNMNNRLSFLLQIILLIFLLSFPLTSLLASDQHQIDDSQSTQKATSVSVSTTSLMLKEVELTDSLVADVPGPGAILGTVIRQLGAASAASDGRIKDLVAGIPNVLPDLEKVLVAL